MSINVSIKPIKIDDLSKGNKIFFVPWINDWPSVRLASIKFLGILDNPVFIEPRPIELNLTVRAKIKPKKPPINEKFKLNSKKSRKLLIWNCKFPKKKRVPRAITTPGKAYPEPRMGSRKLDTLELSYNLYKQKYNEDMTILAPPKKPIRKEFFVIIREYNNSSKSKLERVKFNKIKTGIMKPIIMGIKQRNKIKSFLGRDIVLEYSY